MRHLFTAILLSLVFCSPAFAASSTAEKKSATKEHAAKANTPQAKEIEVNLGGYLYNKEGYSGQLVIYDTLDEENKYGITINTFNEQGNTCEFEGTCERRGGKLICSNDDIKDDKNNFIEIISKGNDLKITKSYAINSCGMGVYIDGSYTPCVTKILKENKKITGTYLGFKEGGPDDYCHTLTVKPADGSDEISICADEDEAKKLFGSTKGKRVEVTYDVERYWNDDAGQCLIWNKLKAGRLLR